MDNVWIVVCEHDDRANVLCHAFASFAYAAAWCQNGTAQTLEFTKARGFGGYTEVSQDLGGYRWAITFRPVLGQDV
jgi:hypothetical protein